MAGWPPQTESAIRTAIRPLVLEISLSQKSNMADDSSDRRQNLISKPDYSSTFGSKIPKFGFVLLGSTSCTLLEGWFKNNFKTKKSQSRRSSFTRRTQLRKPRSRAALGSRAISISNFPRWPPLILKKCSSGISSEPVEVTGPSLVSVNSSAYDLHSRTQC